MMQAKTAGEVKDVWDIRRIIANSLSLKHFVPQDKEQWDRAYEKYLAVTSKAE